MVRACDLPHTVSGVSDRQHISRLGPLQFIQISLRVGRNNLIYLGRCSPRCISRVSGAIDITRAAIINARQFKSISRFIGHLKPSAIKLSHSPDALDKDMVAICVSVASDRHNDWIGYGCGCDSLSRLRNLSIVADEPHIKIPHLNDVGVRRLELEVDHDGSVGVVFTGAYELKAGAAAYSAMGLNGDIVRGA